MCTVVILRRPEHASWPVLIAANRDEMLSRPWRPPARHWPERPEIVAGLDEEAGGTWLGINNDGVAAAVLNRHGSLGPAPGMRSRGELVLHALTQPSATTAADTLGELDPADYRTFNMVVADRADAFWIANRNQEAIECRSIGDGLHMITAWDLDDADSPRIRRFLPQFRDAPVPDPDSADWHGWAALLSARGGRDDETRESAMNVVTDFGFGTCSSSLLALPAGEASEPRWLFAAGRPDEQPYRPVSI